MLTQPPLGIVSLLYRVSRVLICKQALGKTWCLEKVSSWTNSNAGAKERGVQARKGVPHRCHMTFLGGHKRNGHSHWREKEQSTTPAGPDWGNKRGYWCYCWSMSNLWTVTARKNPASGRFYKPLIYFIAKIVAEAGVSRGWSSREGCYGGLWPFLLPLRGSANIPFPLHLTTCYIGL